MELVIRNQVDGMFAFITMHKCTIPAEKYDLARLKELALKCFEELVMLDTTTEVLNVTEQIYLATPENYKLHSLTGFAIWWQYKSAFFDSENIRYSIWREVRDIPGRMAEMPWEFPGWLDRLREGF